MEQVRTAIELVETMEQLNNLASDKGKDPKMCGVAWEEYRKASVELKGVLEKALVRIESLKLMYKNQCACEMHQLEKIKKLEGRILGE